MARTLVEVKRKHIREGSPKSCDRCPVALALKDKGYNNCTVLTTEASVASGDGLIIGSELPRSAQRFIKKFDGGQPVKPFRFYLNLED